MASRSRTLLWGIAVVVFLLGFGGARVRGFWGVSQDCDAWANSHGCHLLQNAWWAKDRSPRKQSNRLGLAVRHLCRRHLTGNRHDRFRQPTSKRLMFALATLRGL